jgi:AbiV family abortive infection protein
MTTKSTKSKTVVIVSSNTILFGVFFALRQAWELVGAATVLQRAEKFPSAYALAVFCREEIGKSKLLEKYWEASTKGKSVSVDDLDSRRMTSHKRKLEAVGKVLSAGAAFMGIQRDPGSSEAQELSRHLLKINVIARQRDPGRTHVGRLRAFYVEIHEAGASWWRPWTAFDSARSSGEILEAEAVYDLRRSELEVLKEKLQRTDIELAASLYLPPELTSP